MGQPVSRHTSYNEIKEHSFGDLNALVGVFKLCLPISTDQYHYTSSSTTTSSVVITYCSQNPPIWQVVLQLCNFTYDTTKVF